MDDGTDVQDQNLVNDQVTEAINDSGVSPGQTVTPKIMKKGPMMKAPTDDAPVAEPAPEAPAEDAVPAPVVDDAPAEEAKPDSFTAEAAPMNTEAITAPAVEMEDDKPAETPEVTEEEDSSDEPELPTIATSGDDDELIDVKQKALEQLSPLVSHLDLPPDQKFDTYMEIIRASDDKSLVQPAFEVAQDIEDEDKKAQALLDVVNEVNYLTQDHKED